MIFEVINDRGEALKPFEILKGKLIGALAKEDTYAFSEKWDSAMERLFGLQDEFFVDYIRSRFIFKKNTKIETAVNQVYHRYIFENNEIAAALSFRKQDECQIDHIKKFINNDLKYYSRLYATVCRNPNNWLVYLNAINTFGVSTGQISLDDVELFLRKFPNDMRKGSDYRRLLCLYDKKRYQ